MRNDTFVTKVRPIRSYKSVLPSAYMEAVSFLAYAFCSYERAYTTLRAPYKHAEALRRESKGNQHSWLSPYHCHNHMSAAHVKGYRTDWGRTAAPWLSHDWATRHTTVCSGQSIADSQTDRLFTPNSTFHLTDWLYKRDEVSQQRHIDKDLIAFTHFSQIRILTQLDSGQPAFQAFHI
jgi:hypothetical protein